MNEYELATQKMLTRLAEDVAALKSITEQTHKDLHGHGQPGLIERVTRLETKVGIFAAVAGVVGSGILELIKHFF